MCWQADQAEIEIARRDGDPRDYCIRCDECGELYECSYGSNDYCPTCGPACCDECHNLGWDGWPPAMPYCEEIERLLPAELDVRRGAPGWCPLKGR